jgi:hypothetical protein
MDENLKEVRTHRVGSITLGSALVLFGILFLVHLFVPVLTYEIIFHIWPCIFILLGIEILLANRKKNVEFVYDGKAVFLTITLTFFAMLMAGADVAIQQADIYMHL